MPAKELRSESSRTSDKAEIIAISGESYRAKEAKERAERKAKERKTKHKRRAAGGDR
jgi:hypothetical protein